MRVFNKGHRHIDHLPPQKEGVVKDDHGERLVKLYPDEIILLDKAEPVAEQTAEVETPSKWGGKRGKKQADGETENSE